MRTKQIVKNSLVTLMTLAFTACTSQQPNVLNNTSNVAVQSDNLSVIKVSDKGASITTNISFGKTFSTKGSSSNGVVEKKAADIQYIDVYLVELGTDPVAGSDPLASGNVIYTKTNLAKTAPGNNLSVLLTGIPANSSISKKYYVAVVAKDLSNTVISKIPTLLWGTTTNTVATSSLAITPTGIHVSSTDLSIDTSVALPLNVYLQDAIGAQVSTDVTATNGSPVIAPVKSSITTLPNQLSVIYGNGTSLTNPQGIVLDSLGNLYIADTGNNLIKKLDGLGNLTIIAGGGTAIPPNTSGTQVATTVTLNNPSSVFVDTYGNIYISDTGNNLVEKIDSKGNIKVIAGGGTGTINTPTTSASGSIATKATLNQPGGIASDNAGNIYIADSGNNYVEKVDTAGNISVVAGRLAGGSPPSSTSSQIATFVALNLPYSLVLDNSGNLYIGDNNYVEKLDTAGNLIVIAGNTTVSAPSPSTNAQLATSVKLNKPSAILGKSGSIYIADRGNNFVEKIDSNGMLKVIAGGGTLTPSTTVQTATTVLLNNPYNLAFDNAGNLYVADSGNNFIEKIAGL